MAFYSDKIAVITGAGSGIGRCLAVLLAQRGARLALSDVNEAALRETAALCGSAEVRCYRLDVSQREQVFAHAAQVQRDFGGAHFIFNNAGITLAATFEHSAPEEIERVISIDLYGVIWGSKAFLPIMLAQREGHIVNISSIFGFVGFPAQAAYNVAKFGVRGLNECLWRELKGSGVRAVSVHPGGIKTNIGNDAVLGRNAGEFERRLVAGLDRLLVTPPEDCARAILEGVARGRQRIVTGHLSGLASWLPRLFPRSYVNLMEKMGM